MGVEIRGHQQGTPEHQVLEDNTGTYKVQGAVPQLQEREASLLGLCLSFGHALERSTERSHQTPENPERH